MSATFNWAYKPGVTNPYGIVIPAGADDVKPAGISYVALHGNDITGNGSRLYPYRSIKDRTGTLICGSGVWRGEAGSTIALIVGDGDVTIDNSILSTQGYVSCRHVKWLSSTRMDGLGSRDCTFDRNIGDSIFRGDAQIKGNTFNTCASVTFNASIAFPSFSALGNNTFYKTPVGITANAALGTYLGGLYFSIFDTCDITFNMTVNGSFDYSLFSNCRFRKSPTDAFTAINDLSTFLAWIESNFPGNPGFSHCRFTSDVKFNNPTIGDFTLAFDSPAKNLSYAGTYVGAKSIGYPIKVTASESTGGFEFASAVNLLLADNSITLTNPLLDAQIDTKIIVNAMARELASLPSYGFNADRNGQYIDSIADLSTTTLAAGETLTAGLPYLVEAGAIVCLGNTYQPGTRFSPTANTTFTTIAGGVVREILEAPQRHTIMARFSDGGAQVVAGDALVIGNYYFVSSGTVTYNSVSYTASKVFKAVNTNPFSGSGTVALAFSNEAYQHYEPGIKPTSNNIGDVRSGAIIRGNGDPAYLRGGLNINEFPINAKFIQVRYYIRVNNLKP
jgi:hypothetical protein